MRVPPESRHILPGLYDSASNLALELERVFGRDATAALTPGQIGAFNQIVVDAKNALPDSVALREDAGEVDAATRPIDAHHILRTTIVPTLHNALPDDAYKARP